MSKINLGLGSLKDLDLVEVFKNGSDELIEETKEILVDAINMLSLNDNKVRASKKSIRKTVDNFAAQCKTFSEYYKALLSGDYLVTYKVYIYEYICKYLQMIAALSEKGNEAYYDTIELASKSKFVEFYLSVQYINQLDVTNEVSSILNNFITEDSFTSKEDKYVKETSKNFNLDAVSYIIKTEFRGSLINRLNINMLKLSEVYRTADNETLANVLHSIYTICDGYADVYVTCKTYKTLKVRTERISDKNNSCISSFDFKTIYLERLEDDSELFNNLRDVFGEDKPEW